VAYPEWPPYKIVQNGTIGGVDTLVLDEIARRAGLEFNYVSAGAKIPHWKQPNGSVAPE
jgi:hypothetical protein